MKTSTATSKEGPVEDLGLHLGWAKESGELKTWEMGVHQREVITKLWLRLSTGRCKKLINRYVTVVLRSEEKRPRMKEAAAHLLNVSTVSPCRTPCTTSPHRILLLHASPPYVFQSSHTRTKAAIPECLALSCETISRYRTDQETFPLRQVETAGCVRSQSYSRFRCQTEAGGGMRRCLAIKVKVRRMVPDLQKIHEPTMPAGRWQIAGCWGHP